MQNSQSEQRLAVECGYWDLCRYNPERRKRGENPFSLDSKAPTRPLKEFLLSELRFAALYATDPDRADKLFTLAEEDCKRTYEIYKSLSENCPL
jgi:pyruvate-ferredoxin/flavodoxin oxidoreductase